MPIDRRADWIIIATRVVLLRSKLLCQASLEAAADIDQLDSLQFIRAAATWLQRQPQLGCHVFTRPNDERNPRVTSYMVLMEVCLTVLRKRGRGGGRRNGVPSPPISDLLSIRNAITRIRTRLAERLETEPLTAFLPPGPTRANDRNLLARSANSSTFVASPDVTRGGELTLAQDGLFAAIAVTSSEPTEPAATEP